MNSTKTLFIYILGFMLSSIFIFESCAKKKKGCTDSKATNYDSYAKEDDGSCTYAAAYDRRDALMGAYNCIDSIHYFVGGLTDTTITEIVSFSKHATDTSKIYITIYGTTYEGPLAGNNFQCVVYVDSAHSFTLFGQFEAGNKVYLQYVFDIAEHSIHGSK